MEIIFFTELKLVMKVGFIFMIPNRKINLWNIVIPFHQESKRQKRNLQLENVCRLFFWNCKGVIYEEYLMKRTTINQQKYVEILKKLQQRINCVHANDTPLFLQDHTLGQWFSTVVILPPRWVLN